MTIKIDEENIIPICQTCKKPLEFLPYRIVTVNDEKSSTKELYYHYFFPCWDPNHFMQIHGRCQIISFGFIYDEKILHKPVIIRNIEKNLDLWV